MELIGEERGRLARAASWLEASPVELVGLAVLLVSALVATGVLVWTAVGRPALGGPTDATVATVGDEHAASAVGTEAEVGSTAGGPDHPAPGTGTDDDGHGAPAGGASGEVIVHVAGAVATPGVVTLPAGSRVADAVEAVGGLLADADPSRINLARPLQDGEQLLVLRAGEEPPPPVAGGAPTPEGADPAVGSGLVDLNAASSEQLQTLPGIGPAIAGRIVQHREQHGPFRTPGDLRDVSGIGEKRFQDLAALITVG
jgi:competence protein ComEA